MKFAHLSFAIISSKIIELLKKHSVHFGFTLIFATTTFSAFAGPSFIDEFTFDKNVSLPDKSGFTVANSGAHGGTFGCTRPNCPERSAAGEHNYLVFSPPVSGTPLISCLSASSTSQLHLAAPFTMTAWVRLDGSPSDNNMQLIASKWLTTHNSREWRFGIQNVNGKLRLIFEKSTNGKGTADSSTLYYSNADLNGKFIRRWIHVAFEMDTLGHKYFSINGVMTDAVQSYGPSSTVVANASAPGRIGCMGGDGFPYNFHGMINEFKISNNLYTSSELAATFRERQRLYAIPAFVWDADVPGHYTKGGSVVDLNGDYLFDRLDKLQSLSQDSYEILAGPFKQLSYENVFGYHYWDLSIPAKTLNATSKKKTDFPNVFLRDVLLPAQARAAAGKLSATITISSDLGRPKRSGDVGECPEDPNQFGDIFTTTFDNGVTYTGCFQATADGKAEKAANRVVLGRVAKSKTAYGAMLRAEGLRMVDQILAYKTLAPNAMSNYYSEDDFLAPRKSLTMFQRQDFVLQVCRKLKTQGMKMHVKSYCGKTPTNTEKYAAAGLLAATNDPELSTIGTKFDLLLLKRFVTADYSSRLTSAEIGELASCIDSVTIYDQAQTVAVGVDDIVPWNINIVGEMNDCVSYIRKSLPNMKINIGIYSYSSDESLKFNSSNAIANIDFARKVAADGYEFFTAPWGRDTTTFQPGFVPPTATTDPLRMNYDVFNYLKDQRLRNDRAPAQQQRPRFTDY